MNILNKELEKSICEKLNIFSKNIKAFESISSTNKYLKSHLKANPDSTLEICMAEQQTHGIGTKGKKWLSPPAGNIYFTYKINLHQYNLLALPIISALSICEAIEFIYPKIQIKVKWPNDLFINQKKIGGILIETLTPTSNQKKENLTSAIIGIGINVNSPKIKNNSDHGELIDQPFSDINSELINASSIKLPNDTLNLKNINITRCEIIANIIQNINKYKSYLLQKNKDKNDIQIKKLLTQWNLKDQYFQKKISIKTIIDGKDKILTGIHSGITDKGELKLKIIEQKKTISIRNGSILYSC
jgi:biotin-[acetyl-CoA-carboxylase] ligase BirA-like protein